ncbi:MAG: hypothetical protein Q8T13_01155 [Acidobacteriota bacterium]|nr:hypothetical protein [Acidobacteriota bacterium]
MADVHAFRSPHVDEAAFERLVLNEVGAAERATLFEHITGCASCARVWRGLLELRREAETEGLIPAAVAPVPIWRSPIVALAVAATLVVVIGGVVLNRQTSDDSTTLRSGTTVGVEELSAVAGAGGTPTLSWSPVPAATSYRLDVFSEDGQLVWTRDVTAPPLSWPDDVPRSAGLYRWRVEALAANAVVARSRLAELEVSR